MPCIRNRAKQGDTMGLTVGSLFSGIGGLDLGLEWAGFETSWFCEIEKFPQAVLRKRWPDTRIIEDVRDVTEKNVQRVDVIAGGFPCQDISWAGIGRGIDYDLSEQEGTRSGLWWEMWRVIRELRPRYVIAENVPALTHRGLDIVLRSLAQIGYDAEWQTISAASVGAPHIRERVFIVAYPEGAGAGRRPGILQKTDGGSPEWIREFIKSGEAHVAHTRGERCEAVGRPEPNGAILVDGRGIEQPDWFGGPTGQPWPVSFKMGDTIGEGLEGHERSGMQGEGRPTIRTANASGQVGDTAQINVESNGQGAGEPKKNSGKWGNEHRGTGSGSGRWVETEYDFRGVAYGVSDRVGALKGYGNAVVPQVGYLVGCAIRQHAEENGWWQ